MKAPRVIIIACALLVAFGVSSASPAWAFQATTGSPGAAGAAGPAGADGPAGPAPTGNAPQVVGYSAANTVEAETLSGSGDCATATLSRAGANSYVLATTCLSSNGNAFTSTTFGATLNLSTVAAASIPFVAIGNSTVTTVLTGASPYTVLSTDKFIVCTTSGGAISLNLPAATGSMRQISVLTDTVANLCTMVRNGTDSINGVAGNYTFSGPLAYQRFVDYATGKWAVEPASFGAIKISGGGATATLTSDGSSNLNNTGGFVSGSNGIIRTGNGIISTTGTGAIGGTGGGVLQSYGGTAPTITANCGTSPSVVTGSNSAFTFTIGSGATATACTISFSASGPFHAAPICVFTDASASVTPVPLATGTTSTTAVDVEFVAATAASKQVNAICIGR